jgi:hypothetical protein
MSVRRKSSALRRRRKRRKRRRREMERKAQAAERLLALDAINYLFAPGAADAFKRQQAISRKWSEMVEAFNCRCIVIPVHGDQQ